ncbi:MAG: response regulator [Nitrospirae bacterium]|nr:response regulator [Nitrospirota bacterium]MBF0534951.1 response regulator [Nitrospirota bacterium]MBF0617198.1 response regulator [Nitrospirota bacterium]
MTGIYDGGASPHYGGGASPLKFNILVVDDEAGNRQAMRQILKDSYKLSFATDGTEALNIAQREKPDMILLDVMMPGIDGYDTCCRLKENPETEEIPVIFITSLAEVGDESRGFEAGGVDYITKPVSPSVVLHRVAAHLEIFNQKRLCEETVKRRTKQLQESQESAIFMLGDAGHFNDSDTGSHIWRMASYSVEIARACAWPVEVVEIIALAAAMHDTGKIGVPGSILRKPAKLDPEEWKIMMTHSSIGHSILSKSNTPLFRMSADIAYYHHERWDGTGYPKGLRGKEIPQSAAIVAVADVFDALTMVRPYKEAWPVDKAMDEIKRCAGSHFDPHIVARFFDVEDEIRRLKEFWDEREKDGN